MSTVVQPQTALNNGKSKTTYSKTKKNYFAFTTIHVKCTIPKSNLDTISVLTYMLKQ